MRAIARSSRSFTLSKEDKATLDAIASAIGGVGGGGVAGGATETTLAALLAKIIAAPATEAKQDAVITALGALAANSSVDGIEGALAILNATDFATQTTLAAVLAKLIAAPATEAKQDTAITALGALAPPVPGAAEDRTFNDTSAQSGALTGTLIRVIARGADCRIAIGANPTATATGTLIVAGVPEFFRITSGHKVAAIRDAATDGTLNITVCS